MRARERRTLDGEWRRRTTNGNIATTTTEVGSPPYFFPSFFSFLAVSPDLKIWCMEIVSEGLLFIEIFFFSVVRRL